MSGEMVNSDIPWIGEIPKAWKMYRVKYNTFLKGRIGWQGLNSNDFIDEGYCLITGTDFDNKGGINWNTCYRISKERFDEDELLHIKNGDLLMTKDGTVGKMAYIQNLPEEASLNSHLLIIRQTSNIICNKFLYWIMLSDVFKHFCLMHQSGTIMNSIGQSTLGLLCCYCPSIAEQQKIADYLDRKCAEIDEMIGLQEQIIEELKAYKQSVITEAVTKGLNPAAPMRDSGIEWIGSIPEHWETAYLKHFCKVNSGREIEAELEQAEVDAVPVYGSGGVFKYTNKAQFVGEAVMFGRKGTLGKPIYVNGSFWAVDTMYYLTFGNMLKAKYCFYQLSAFNWEPYITQTALPSIVATDIVNTPFVFPPLTEQQAIADYLDEKCADIDALIATKQQKIDLLKEYKKSIIYEYVTGKKEVI